MPGFAIVNRFATEPRRCSFVLVDRTRLSARVTNTLRSRQQAAGRTQVILSFYSYYAFFTSTSQFIKRYARSNRTQFLRRPCIAQQFFHSTIEKGAALSEALIQGKDDLKILRIFHKYSSSKANFKLHQAPVCLRFLQNVFVPSTFDRLNVSSRCQRCLAVRALAVSKLSVRAYKRCRTVDTCPGQNGEG